MPRRPVPPDPVPPDPRTFSRFYAAARRASAPAEHGRVGRGHEELTAHEEEDSASASATAACVRRARGARGARAPGCGDHAVVVVQHVRGDPDDAASAPAAAARVRASASAASSRTALRDDELTPFNALRRALKLGKG